MDKMGFSPLFSLMVLFSLFNTNNINDFRWLFIYVDNSFPWCTVQQGCPFPITI